jgi:hypothetical protein
VVEIGAGTGIPTVRLKSESLFTIADTVSLVRINPREQEVMIADKGIHVINESQSQAPLFNNKNII